MSAYQSSKRWSAKGVGSKTEQVKRAPGFCRELFDPAVVIPEERVQSSDANECRNNTERDNERGDDNDRCASSCRNSPIKGGGTGLRSPTGICEGLEADRTRMSDVFFLGPGVTFQSASASRVLRWIDMVSGVDIVESMDFVELTEDFMWPEDVSWTVAEQQGDSPRGVMDNTRYEQIEFMNELDERCEEGNFECDEGGPMVTSEERCMESPKTMPPPPPLYAEPSPPSPTPPSPREVLLKIHKEYENDLWEKLKLLITAAVLVFDEDISGVTNLNDDTDSYISRKPKVKPRMEFPLMPRLSPPTSPRVGISMSRRKKYQENPALRQGKGVIQRRKMILLFTAFFQMIPKDVLDTDDDTIHDQGLQQSDHQTKEATTTTNQQHGLLNKDEENILLMEHKLRVRKLFERSMRLCPRTTGKIGLTPLAVAAAAVHISPPSSSSSSSDILHQKPLNEGPQEMKLSDLDSDDFVKLLSRRVIDRMLELNPKAAKQQLTPKHTQKDNNMIYKQLPLHLAVQSGKDWEDGIGSIYSAHPDATHMVDTRGWLPIHYAAACPRTPLTVIKKLLELYPDGAEFRDDEGRCPLHLAAENGKTWATGLGEFFSAFPEAAIMPNKKGRLPAYYRVSTKHSHDEKTTPFTHRRSHQDSPSRRKPPQEQETSTPVMKILENLVSKSKCHRDNFEYNGGRFPTSPSFGFPVFTDSPTLFPSSYSYYPKEDIAIQRNVERRSVPPTQNKNSSSMPNLRDRLKEKYARRLSDSSERSGDSSV